MLPPQLLARKLKVGKLLARQAVGLVIEESDPAVRVKHDAVDNALHQHAFASESLAPLIVFGKERCGKRHVKSELAVDLLCRAHIVAKLGSKEELYLRKPHSLAVARCEEALLEKTGKLRSRTALGQMLEIAELQEIVRRDTALCTLVGIRARHEARKMGFLLANSR